jgi:DNA-binding winged helix-turn-helix (wHTH) protein
MPRFHPFRLDTVNQCLWRRRDSGDEERHMLPPKAYAVLRHLIERAGRLVTQDELLDAVWPDTHIQPEGLKSQILHIRRVLGDHPKRPRFIETLPRRGYRFIGADGQGAAQKPAVQGRPAPSNLVGRERALGELGDGLRKALQSKRQIAFVTGESGIGITALVDAFQLLAESEVPGLRIACGRCVEGYGGKEPYYPMLEALGQLCRGHGGDSVVSTLAAQAPTWLAQFPALLTDEHRETLQREILGATRERMLREISEALETITLENPLLLVFEDLQWVDQATVDLISALARRRAPAKLMLIGTYRPVDLALADHPLKALKQDLLLHKLSQEIALEPLSEADISAFLAAPSPEASEPAGLAELMHRHSGGNPLFMVAALEHLTQRGLISRESGAWQMRQPLEQIVVGVPSPRYEFVHALYREVFYQRQAPRRRAKLHRRVGEALEVLFSERLSDVAPDLADHFEKSADWPRAIRYLRLAADRAGRRYAHREATVLLQEALGLASRLPDSDRTATETEISEKLATIHVERSLHDFEAARRIDPRQEEGHFDKRTHAHIEQAVAG